MIKKVIKEMAGNVLIKKFFLVALICISCISSASAQQTYWTPGTPPGSTSFLPTFRYKAGSTDSAMNFYWSNVNKWYQIYTAEYLNKNFVRSANLDSVVFGKQFTGRGTIDTPLAIKDAALTHFNYITLLNDSGWYSHSNNFYWDDVNHRFDVVADFNIASTWYATYAPVGSPDTSRGILRVGNHNIVYTDTIQYGTRKYVDSFVNKFRADTVFGTKTYIGSVNYRDTVTYNNVRVNYTNATTVFSGTSSIQNTSFTGSDAAAFFDGLGYLQESNHFFIENSEMSMTDGTTPQHTQAAILALRSTTKGFMPPSMTAAQRSAIVTDVEYDSSGDLVYQTDGSKGLYNYMGTSLGWHRLLTDRDTVGGAVTLNSLTFNNSGSGATSGAAFDGYTAKTISYNTIGAIPGTITSANKVTVVNSNGDSQSDDTWQPQLRTSLGSNFKVLSNGRHGDGTYGMLLRQNNTISGVTAAYEVVLGGINDVSVLTALKIEANLQAIYTSAHNAGSKVIAITILPFGGSSIWTSGSQAVADSVNTWILNTSTGATNVDYRIDMRPVVWDSSNHQNLNPTLDDGDHIHLNTTGWNLMGTTIYSDVPFTASSNTPIINLSQNTITIDQNLRSDTTVRFKEIHTSILNVQSDRDASYPMPQISNNVLSYFSVAKGSMEYDTTANLIRYGNGTNHLMVLAMDSAGAVRGYNGAVTGKIALPQLAAATDIYNATNTSYGYLDFGSSTSGLSVGRNVADAHQVFTINNLNASSTGDFIRGVLNGSEKWYVDYTGAGNFSNLNDAGLSVSSPVFTDASKNLTSIGIVPYTNGGTNASTSWTQGSILFADATALAQNNADFFWDNSNNRLGLMTAAPTHTLSLGSTANGITYYNTSDQTTNYERTTLAWSSNSFLVQSQNGGTGLQRGAIFDFASQAFRVGGATVETIQSNGITGAVNIAKSQSGSSNQSVLGVTSSFTNSAATNFGISILPTLNQTSTAGSTLLWISPLVTAQGSGTQLLADFGTNSGSAGSGTHTSKFSVSYGGTVTYGGGLVGGVFTENTSSFATTTTQGILSYNGAAATSGVPAQNSPYFDLSGRVWNTSGTPASNRFDVGEEVRGTSGSSPSYKLYWMGKLQTGTSAPTSWDADLMSLDNGGNLTLLQGTLGIKSYTVATLPAAGTAGRTAYVTDATAPTYLGTLTGGGTVKTPVFDNGTAWVSY